MNSNVFSETTIDLRFAWPIILKCLVRMESMQPLLWRGARRNIGQCDAIKIGARMKIRISRDTPSTL